MIIKTQLKTSYYKTLSAQHFFSIFIKMNIPNAREIKNNINY